MTRRLLRLFTAVWAAVVLTACDVHEFPHPDEPQSGGRQVTLSLRFDRDMPLFQEIEYGEGMRRTRAEELELRYIVRAFSDVRGADSRAPRREWIFYRSAEADPDADFVVTLPEEDIRLIVWCDIVRAADRADFHYSTGDFSEIMLRSRNPHAGSDDSRDAFRGDEEVASSETSVTIPMQRPLAKFRFITNDIQQFISNETKGHPDRIPADPDTRGIDLTSYGVRFTYPRYMACSFNMFTNRPADSWAGVSFESVLRRIDDDRAEVGFDYIFVNSHDTSVNVGVEVYDKQTGTILARINPIDVPLSRSKITIVTGPFLTTKAEGGVGINPDFDGDFNIFIQ